MFVASFVANNQLDPRWSRRNCKRSSERQISNRSTPLPGALLSFQHCVHHIEPCLVAFPASGCSLDVMIVSTKYSLHLSQNRACMVLRQCHNSGRRASINKPHAVPARYVAQFCPSSLNARSDTIFIGIPRASVNRWCCTGLESSLTKQCVQAVSSTDGFPFASLVERHAIHVSGAMFACFASAGPQALSHKLPTPPPRARLAQLTLDQPIKILTWSWCAQSVCKQSSRLMPALDQHTGDMSLLFSDLCYLWCMTGDT